MLTQRDGDFPTAPGDRFPVPCECERRSLGPGPNGRTAAEKLLESTERTQFVRVLPVRLQVGCRHRIAAPNWQPAVGRDLHLRGVANCPHVRGTAASGCVQEKQRRNDA